MEDMNQKPLPKTKKNLWQNIDQLLPGFTYKAVAVLMAVGLVSMIFRWIKWHI
ncbi:MAG: hypothetical protein Q7V63_02280 [Gammaproteobacteria bacterium]|nr:hypothetical protein [Gammaproteobacteria bacterium]